MYSSNIIEEIGRELGLDLTRKRYTRIDVRKLVKKEKSSYFLVLRKSDTSIIRSMTKRKKLCPSL